MATPMYNPESSHSETFIRVGTVLATTGLVAAALSGCGVPKNANNSSTSSTTASGYPTTPRVYVPETTAPVAPPEGRAPQIGTATSTTLAEPLTSQQPAPALPSAAPLPPANPQITAEGKRMPFVPRTMTRDGKERFFTSTFTKDYGANEPNMSNRWYTSSLFKGPFPLLFGPGKTNNPEAPTKMGFLFDMPCNTVITASEDTRIIPADLVGLNVEYYGGSVVYEWGMATNENGQEIPRYLVIGGLNKVLKNPGEQVRAGEIIGLSGNTGQDGERYGCHLGVTAFSKDSSERKVLDLGEIDTLRRQVGGVVSVQPLLQNFPLPKA